MNATEINSNEIKKIITNNLTEMFNHYIRDISTKKEIADTLGTLLKIDEEDLSISKKQFEELNKLSLEWHNTACNESRAFETILNAQNNNPNSGIFKDIKRVYGYFRNKAKKEAISYSQTLKTMIN